MTLIENAIALLGECTCGADSIGEGDCDVCSMIKAIREYGDKQHGEAEISLHRHYANQLEAIEDMVTAISDDLDEHLTLNLLLDRVATQLKVDAAAVLLHKSAEVLEFAAGRGFRSGLIKHSLVQVGNSYAGQAAKENHLVTLHDLTPTNASANFAKMLAEEGFVDYLALPLIAANETKGVLEVYHREAIEFDEAWFDYLRLMAGLAAIAVHNKELKRKIEHANIELEVAYGATLEGWMRALEMRDRYTEGHTQRVAELSLRLATMLNVPDRQLVHITRGAMLHDIGKIAIPDHILQKEGPLTEEEWEIMRKHPIYAYEMLTPISYLESAIDIPYCHHERWDGSGYPRALKDEEIPLSARIFAVADVWDALRSDRPYREAWPAQKALSYIRSQSGKYFDPSVVVAFLGLIKHDLETQPLIEVNPGEIFYPNSKDDPN